jgi:hypothetical protein
VEQLEWSRNALNKITITVFEVSDDGKRVKCMVCTPFNTLEQWMLRDSHSSHLKSCGHRENVAHSPGQTFEDRVMAADSAAHTDAVLQDLVFARLQGVDVCTDASSSKGFQGPTAGEQEMWQNYDINGADFEIADDPDQLWQGIILKTQLRTLDYGTLKQMVRALDLTVLLRPMD